MHNVRIIVGASHLCFRWEDARALAAGAAPTHERARTRHLLATELRFHFDRRGAGRNTCIRPRVLPRTDYLASVGAAVSQSKDTTMSSSALTMPSRPGLLILNEDILSGTLPLALSLLLSTRVKVSGIPI